MKCPRCQFDNPDDTTFCGNCAAPLRPTAGSSSSLPSASSSAPSSGPPSAPSSGSAPPHSGASGAPAPAVSESRPLNSPLPTETLQAPVRELDTGATFAGRYQVIEELGRGGMGRVYKVYDTELKEKIALKLLRPELALDPETLERFRNELKSARQVAHKNVCRMFDLGRAAGTGAPFITMEYVPGEDLKRLIRKIGQLPAGRAVSIARQTAEGLAEAHAHGIVHRDLKPQNLMVDEGGNVRIMDFGIARSLEKKGLTGAGVMIGTPEYMSPEQVEGKPVDARSDIYSLGIILYEMTTGRVPFEGDTPFTIGVKHKSEAPRDPRALNPALPPDLAALILRCLEKDRDKRFASASDLVAELGRIEQSLPTSERVVPRHHPPRTSKQVTVTFDIRKVAVPALAALFVVAAALVLWLVVLKRHIVRPPSGRPELAVVYFKNNTGDANLDIWRTALPELVISDLSQSRYIDVVSDSQIYGVLRDLSLSGAATYTPEDLKHISEKTGATHILHGTLTRAGTSFRINTTLEDPLSGKVLGTEMVQGEGEASFHTMVDELGRKIKAGLQLTTQEIASDIDRDVGQITSASPEAYKLYAQGRAYHLARDYKNSIALLEKAVAIDPEFAMAYRSLSAAYSNLGFRAKADECRRKALEFADRISDRERWLIEGNFYYNHEETYGKAIEAFNKVLALYPDDLIANNSLGVIYSSIEEPDKSAGYFETCIKQRGASYFYYANLSGIYTELGQYERARDVILGFLRTGSDAAAPHLDLADIFIYEGRYDQALAEADKAFALAPTDIDVDRVMGQAAMFKGDFARAEAEFKKQAEAAIRANRPWLLRYLAAYYLSQGRFKEALEQIAIAQDAARKVGEPAWLAPFNFFAALVYSGAGRSAEILKVAEQSYRMAEAAGNWVVMRYACYMKGHALLGLKSPAEAREAADELKALIDKGMNKKSIRAWQSLEAEIDLAAGNAARAVENAKAAVDSLGPQSDNSNPDGYYWNTLARAYEAAGDWEGARRAYEGLQKLTTGRFWSGNLYALSFYRTGMIAEKTGDKAAARANYRRFLELWKNADAGLPEPADARKRLAALG
jgi:serine/threonine protein kinase/tetratricopeptide (TPR) repeat protein